MESSSVFIQSWTFAFSVWVADGLQVSGDTVEKWIVRFNLSTSPGSFIPSGAEAVVRWVQKRRLLCLALSVLAVMFLVSAICWLSPVMLDEKVLCNRVFPIPRDDA